MMGGFTYTTKQGDMWDYIAWRVYGDESLVYLLYRENPKYLDTFIFDEYDNNIKRNLTGIIRSFLIVGQ